MYIWYREYWPQFVIIFYYIKYRYIITFFTDGRGYNWQYVYIANVQHHLYYHFLRIFHDLSNCAQAWFLLGQVSYWFFKNSVILKLCLSQWDWRFVQSSNKLVWKAATQGIENDASHTSTSWIQIISTLSLWYLWLHYYLRDCSAKYLFE